jgi:hypoxanthine phosphoribosyltransferase
MQNFEEECRNWAEEMKQNFQPDIVIYIAKAGYLIGKTMSEVYGVPLAGISAVRKGNKLKSIIGPVFSMVPCYVRNKLIELELNSNFHKMDSERHVEFITDINSFPVKDIKNVIIVDDSVDTGYTLKAVKETVRNHFTEAVVRTAGFNVWDKSREVIVTDYALFRNTIIKAPMSKDSKDYKKFIKKCQLIED